MHFYNFPCCTIIEIIINNIVTKKIYGIPSTYYKNITLNFTNEKLVRKLYENSNIEIDICRCLNYSM